MAYDFTDIPSRKIRAMLAVLFSVDSGHDHDGTNSKLVELTGTPAEASVDTAQIKAGALAATADGRGKFAANFFDAATLAAKIATAAFAATAPIRALFADGIWTLAKLAATARTQVVTYQVENLGAGADLTTRAIFEVPAGLVATVTNCRIISQGTAAGVDDDNTCIIAVTDGTNTIATITYDTDLAFPAENVSESLGAIGAHGVLNAAEKLCFTITNGTAANPPAFMIQVTYTLTDAA